MYNGGGSPTVTNCDFSGNTASNPGYDGGGMFNDASSAKVTNCTFVGNMASGGGGGMYNAWGSPTVTNCWFSKNTALSGGGMFTHRSSVTVTNCTFSGNTVTLYGGGMTARASGGAVVIVTGCTFRGNKADYGGGMTNFSGGGPTTVANCTFSGNIAAFDGGGMYIYSRPTVINCTFGGNIATNAGGGMYILLAPTLANSILWGDSPDEIVNVEPYSGAPPPAIRFSDVQGGLPVGAVDGGGNIDLDPMFVRLPNPWPDGTWDGVDDDYGDLRLRGGSPCIDTGDPGFVAQPGETDLEGHARVLCGRVDMGAYEYGIGDYDCDQSVNLTDLAGWVTCVTGPTEGGSADPPYPIGCEAFDFDGDGDVDLLDFSGFQRIIGR